MATQLRTPSNQKDGHAALPATFFPPYAIDALREALHEAEYIVAKDSEIAIEQRAPFVIDRCEYVIGRMREALSRADGQAELAARLAGGVQ